MKGLTQNCCQCGSLIKNDSIHMWCSCLIALCTSCGLQQLATKPTTYNSHVTCPVCGNQDTNVANRVIEGVSGARSLELTYIKQACTNFNEPKPKSFSRNNDAELLPLYKKLLKRYADLGYPLLPVDADMTRREHLAIAGLHIARCEAHREQNQMDKGLDQYSEFDGPLALGPLERITFKINHTLEKVLDIVRGQESVTQLPAACSDCSRLFTPGTTVRSFCSCFNNALQLCQLCQRRAISKCRQTFHESPISCKFCNCATISIGNIEAAEAHQEQLLQRHPAYKKTANTDKLWSFYCEIAASCSMNITIPYVDFIELRNVRLDQGSKNLHTKPMCFLEMARMEVERARRTAAGVPKKEKSDVSNLPLGPLARLDIARNLVLETFLTFLRGGKAREAQLKETRATRSAEQQLMDPDSLFDEVQGRVCSEVVPGGELSAEVCQLIENEVASSATRNGKLLLRTQSTPCPHEGCTVNPYCPVYLEQHIQTRHGTPVPVATHAVSSTVRSSLRSAHRQDGQCMLAAKTNADAPTAITAQLTSAPSHAAFISTAKPNYRQVSAHGTTPPAVTTTTTTPTAAETQDIADGLLELNNLSKSTPIAHDGSTDSTDVLIHPTRVDTVPELPVSRAMSRLHSLIQAMVPPEPAHSASVTPIDNVASVGDGTSQAPAVNNLAAASVNQSVRGLPGTADTATITAPRTRNCEQQSAVQRPAPSDRIGEDASVTAQVISAVTPAPAAPTMPATQEQVELSRPVHAVNYGVSSAASARSEKSECTGIVALVDQATAHSTISSSIASTSSATAQNVQHTQPSSEKEEELFAPATLTKHMKPRENDEEHRKKRDLQAQDELRELLGDHHHEHSVEMGVDKAKTKATAIAEAAALQKRREILLEANRMLGRTSQDIERRKREAAEAAQRPRKVRFSPTMMSQPQAAAQTSQSARSPTTVQPLPPFQTTATDQPHARSVPPPPFLPRPASVPLQSPVNSTAVFSLGSVSSSRVSAGVSACRVSGVSTDSPYAYSTKLPRDIDEYKKESFTLYYEQPYRAEDADQARARRAIPYNYHGMPYMEDINRFSGPILAKPEDAWRGGEEYVNLQRPDERHYELSFEADSPKESHPLRPLTTRVEFFLVFPKGALKELKEQEPCRYPYCNRVKICIETTQAQLNAVSRMLESPKYGFRGSIVQWANKKGGLLQSKGTFHKYSVRPGSDIVMRDISCTPGASNEHNYTQFWEYIHKPRKRMSNAAFAFKSVKRQSPGPAQTPAQPRFGCFPASPSMRAWLLEPAAQTRAEALRGHPRGESMDDYFDRTHFATPRTSPPVSFQVHKKRMSAAQFALQAEQKQHRAREAARLAAAAAEARAEAERQARVAKVAVGGKRKRGEEGDSETATDDEVDEPDPPVRAAPVAAASTEDSTAAASLLLSANNEATVFPPGDPPHGPSASRGAVDTDGGGSSAQHDCAPQQRRTDGDGAGGVGGAQGDSCGERGGGEAGCGGAGGNNDTGAANSSRDGVGCSQSASVHTPLQRPALMIPRAVTMKGRDAGHARTAKAQGPQRSASPPQPTVTTPTVPDVDSAGTRAATSSAARSASAKRQHDSSSIDVNSVGKHSAQRSTPLTPVLSQLSRAAPAVFGGTRPSASAYSAQAVKPSPASSQQAVVTAKPRFGGVVDFDNEESSEEKEEGFLRVRYTNWWERKNRWKRSGGRKKIRRGGPTGSTNFTGHSNNSPPIYFDHTAEVRFSPMREVGTVESP